LMDGRDYVGPTAVQAAVLPARAVYLVADGSEGGLRRAVQEACTRWGGMTEPIIPVKPGGEIDPWWQQVVSTARADSAVNVDADPDDAAKVAETLGLGLVSLADIDDRGLASFTVHPDAVGPGELPGPNAYVMASEKRGLWEVVGAGDLTDAHVESLGGSGFYTRRPHEDEVARAQLSGGTLVERTCSQFAEHWARGLEFGPAVVWVTEPGSFADCIFFWNLRALRPLRYGSLPMLLLPVGQVQYWLHFAAELGHVLERPGQFEPDVAVCSLAVSDADLDKTASELELQHHEGEPRIGHAWPAAPRKPPYTYQLGLDARRWLDFERSYGQVTDVDVQLFRGTTAVRFASPVEFGRGAAALVRLSGALLDGLPRHPAVAERIIKGGIWRDGALQIIARGWGDSQFEIHVPELAEVTAALLGAATTRHALSAKKGQAGMAWLQQTDISPLVQPGVFAAIRALTTRRSKELVRELRKLRQDGAVDDELAEIAAHWGGRSERRYRCAEQLERDDGVADAAGALERLCAAGWAERGLSVTCGACGLPSFVPFAEATGRANCPGCSSPAEYETGSALVVYYRLSSHLDLLSDQGVLPHLLTIAALQRQAKQSHFLPGVDVWFSADDSEKAEADIFGVRDGQVLSGEVKTRASEFTPEQVTRDVKLSSRLGADTHILAATDDIPAEVTELARKLCTASGLTLLTFGKTDLLPSG
jgi:hypothetical protein